ncbi:MAG: ClbS/DfsB family four-helix bundle protein [Planctomycetota bacterium]|jgi:hypothetical protein
MSESGKPMGRDDVLARLRETYGELDELLGRLSEEEMAKVRIHGDWTVKKMLAHLASWESLESGWMEAVIEGRKPHLYTEGFEWDRADFDKRCKTIDRYNAFVLERTANRSLDDVLTEFRGAQKRMLELVARWPENALRDPGVFFWLAVEVPRDPWVPLPVNSYEHYIDHAGWLRTWLSRERDG